MPLCMRLLISSLEISHRGWTQCFCQHSWELLLRLCSMLCVLLGDRLLLLPVSRRFISIQHVSAEMEREYINRVKKLTPCSGKPSKRPLKKWLPRSVTGSWTRTRELSVRLAWWATHSTLKGPMEQERLSEPPLSWQSFVGICQAFTGCDCNSNLRSACVSPEFFTLL